VPTAPNARFCGGQVLNGEVLALGAKLGRRRYLPVMVAGAYPRQVYWPPRVLLDLEDEQCAGQTDALWAVPAARGSLWRTGRDGSWPSER
jgi:hypothetical protein